MKNLEDRDSIRVLREAASAAKLCRDLNESVV